MSACIQGLDLEENEYSACFLIISQIKPLKCVFIKTEDYYEYISDAVCSSYEKVFFRGYFRALKSVEKEMCPILHL